MFQTYTNYPNGIIFFANRGCYAYALDADAGTLVWRSPQLHADTFSIVWPVVIGDYVTFYSSPFYGAGQMIHKINRYATTHYWSETQPLVDANGWLDLSHHQSHLDQYPERKSVFILDRNTGQEALTSVFLFWGNPWPSS